MTRWLAFLVVVAGFAKAEVVAQAQKPIWRAEPPSEYLVRKIATPPVFSGKWEEYWQSPAWSRAAVLQVDRFHEKRDSEFPVTQAKLLYDDNGVHVFFRVEDRYVRSVTTAYQGPVFRDACVEFFFEPDPKKGYINIEVNAGGTPLMKYHDPALQPGQEESPPGYRLVLLPWEHAKQVQIRHSLPKVINPEITEPVTWYIQYFVPFAILEEYFGKLRPLSGRIWRANFYKISLDNSHPHRATWAPIPPAARAAGFHQPAYFAPIRFE